MSVIFYQRSIVYMSWVYATLLVLNYIWHSTVGQRVFVYRLFKKSCFISIVYSPYIMGQDFLDKQQFMLLNVPTSGRLHSVRTNPFQDWHFSCQYKIDASILVKKYPNVHYILSNFRLFLIWKLDTAYCIYGVCIYVRWCNFFVLQKISILFRFLQLLLIFWWLYS